VALLNTELPGLSSDAMLTLRMESFHQSPYGGACSILIKCDIDERRLHVRSDNSDIWRLRRKINPVSVTSLPPTIYSAQSKSWNRGGGSIKRANKGGHDYGTNIMLG
jgi:hypothetical protein